MPRGNTVVALLVATLGRSFSVFVINFALAESLAGVRCGGFRSLDEDQRVEFEVTQGPKGPQAARVRVV